MNISSLPYNYEQLYTLLADIDINFYILGITETRLRTGQKALNNIDIEKYVIEHTTTDASCGGALLYIKEGITYKVRNELKITSLYRSSWNQWLVFPKPSWYPSIRK